MGGEDFSSERELLYKILFDMRSDINDVKRMLSELMHSAPHPAPTAHEVRGLLPSSMVTPVEDYTESEEVVEVPHRELTKADMQREQILRALKNNHGRRRDAARELFMSERTLYRRIKELGISDDEF
jgi:DNA-binding NtrC family response regulator